MNFKFKNLFKSNKQLQEEDLVERTKKFLLSFIKYKDINNIEELEKWLEDLRSDMSQDVFLAIIEAIDIKKRVVLAKHCTDKVFAIFDKEMSNLEQACQFALTNHQKLQKETLKELEKFMLFSKIRTENVNEAFKYLIKLLIYEDEQ